MPISDIHLKTKQVADAVGLGVSTVKRWVDTGEIEATKTVGGHRLISLAEALRFARRMNLSTTVLEGLVEAASPGAVTAVDGATRDLLVERLREGRVEEARRLIVGAHEALGSGEALGDELIAPAMERVGHGWIVGDWDIYHEHQGSQIVSTALTDLIVRARRRGDGPAPLALGAAPAGDYYILAGLLAELTLTEVGYEVRNLGANLPMASLARAVDDLRPRMVYITVSHLLDPDSFVRDYRYVDETARAAGAAVVVGGRALGPEVLARLDLDQSRGGQGSRMADLASIGRRLLLATDDAPGATTEADRRGPTDDSGRPRR